MKILIYLTVIIIAIAFFAFIIAMIMYVIDKHDPDSKWLEKVDNEYNQKMIQMCIDAKQAGKCPDNCKKCSWGTRSVNGIIEFGRKP